MARHVLLALAVVAASCALLPAAAQQAAARNGTQHAGTQTAASTRSSASASSAFSRVLDVTQRQLPSLGGMLSLVRASAACRRA